MAVGEINESSESGVSDGAAEAAGAGGAQRPAALSVQSAGTIYYPVAPGVQVNVRRGPNTGSQIVKVLGENSRVPIRCQTRGETVSGPYGTTDVWDSIAPGQYVSDAYVKTGSDGFVAIRCS
ncbi:SH3 domain-containing protein [Streptomyces albireticuli]|uniref:SH3 domain-containing protein n=1 Tax=Streptomyces albireticuli TaxID=1940 RepID=UPI001E34FFB2|nr:SH3 domain-containing protein [Streptomyces albireticuli]MCD9145308.1 SH3 domain-containing protein [Streptomyces albireticuli]MCD9164517.1 SH3 domain-containing protein [Streptomyces albireticuli]MCD9194782.1 SH3 domain-containing protein [Streptomyces albireticuli]